MLHFIVDKSKPGAKLRLFESDYHYLKHVLRIKKGNFLTVMNATGHKFSAEVTIISSGFIEILVGNQLLPNNKKNYKFTLLQALPKGNLMDKIIRQSTELGIETIVPVISSRTQGKIKGDSLKKMIVRWNRISREASQQSGSLPLRIASPLSLNTSLFDLKKTDLQLVFDINGPILSKHLCESKRFASITIAIGPEGGFTIRELEFLNENGFHTVSLGSFTLRVDTAVIAAISAIEQVATAIDDWLTTPQIEKRIKNNNEKK